MYFFVTHVPVYSFVGEIKFIYSFIRSLIKVATMHDTDGRN